MKLQTVEQKKLAETIGNKRKGKSKRNHIVLILLSLLSFTISLKASLWIAENFFFDKFFYYKSIKHGYLIPGKYLPYQAYGKRGRDLASLTEQTRELNERRGAPQILGTTDDGVYTIAVVGDSMVWGQGLREKERFANVLERRLDRISPTRVISLGYPGDSMLDNYIKYTLMKHLNPSIDLYIFGVVDNDLFLNKPDRYDSALFEEVVDVCREKPLFYDPPFNPSQDAQEHTQQYAQNVKMSFSDSYANPCIFKKTASLLPQRNAIYLIFAPRSIQYDQHFSRMEEIMQRNELFILTVSQYFEQMSGQELHEKYYISDGEGHPSAFANEIFAQALFQEITRNPRWRFTDLMKR
ncbi:MAG TPA: SGNH/GDSL hydrolase family protein [Patescibacteria group bacterium]|nr:SGNH/GDSL hydrolase family protein [Patescibacteria group bacterium]